MDSTPEPQRWLRNGGAGRKRNWTLAAVILGSAVQRFARRSTRPWASRWQPPSYGGSSPRFPCSSPSLVACHFQAPDAPATSRTGRMARPRNVPWRQCHAVRDGRSLAGVGEELLFRALFKRSWANGLRPSSDCYSRACSQIFGHMLSKLYFAFAIVVGAFLGWLALAYHDLVAPMIAHGFQMTFLHSFTFPKRLLIAGRRIRPSPTLRLMNGDRTKMTYRIIKTISAELHQASVIAPITLIDARRKSFTRSVRRWPAMLHLILSTPPR